MSNNANKPPITFWVITIIGFIWNLMGVDAYLQQAYRTERFQEMYKNTPQFLEIINNLPSWYTAVFAIAVFISTLGCLLLLLRKKMATQVFLVALIAVVIQTLYNLFMNEGRAHYETFQYVMLIMIPLFSLFLYSYAKKASFNRWIS